MMSDTVLRDSDGGVVRDGSGNPVRVGSGYDECLNMPPASAGTKTSNGEKDFSPLDQWVDVTLARINVARAMRRDIVEKNPDIFKDLQEAVKNNIPDYIKKRKNIDSLNPNLQQEVLKANKEFNDAVFNEMRDNGYSKKEIRQALAAVNCAVMTEPKPSLGSMFTKPFYNEETGEPKFGGVIGAVAGLLGGMMFFGGGEGGLMSYVGMAVMAVLGVMGGNKIAEWFDTPKTPSNPLTPQVTGPSQKLNRDEEPVIEQKKPEPVSQPVEQKTQQHDPSPSESPVVGNNASSTQNTANTGTSGNPDSGRLEEGFIKFLVDGGVSIGENFAPTSTIPTTPVKPRSMGRT